jgi:molybdopterin synthase sulfur carrier subunit
VLRLIAIASVKIMAVTFYIAGYLAGFADGQSTVSLDCAPPTVGEALNALWQKHLGLRDRVLTDTGEVRPHVNVFVGNRSIKWESGLETGLNGNEEISILPAVSGG